MAKILPEDFRKYTLGLMGEKLYQQLEQGITEGEAPTSIRLNPFKCKEGEDVSSPKEPIPWCPSTGRYLSTRPNFTFDPWLHAGKYYVQEASSMFVDLVIRQLVHEPVMMLDLCAAPGGKSTAVRAALPEGSLLFSNEPMRTRSQILAENIQKFGHPDMIVTNNYPRDYKKSKLQFDVILTDVPCSGEGMFRKDDGAIAEWSLQNVDNCWHLQREIVSDIWSGLKPGGILIYSTCTFNAHEDEENVDFIVDTWEMEKLDMRHFIPGETRTEGLFMAALRKPGSGNPVMSASAGKKKDKKAKKGKQSKSSAVQGAKTVSSWLTAGENFDVAMLGGRVVGVGKAWRDVFDTSLDKLRVIHAGVELGEQKGKDIVPSESLALSLSLAPDAFPVADVDMDTALSYLRREPITLSGSMPHGYVLVSYKGLPLGFVKNLGNRTNNLFPQEWRIRNK